MVHVKFQDQRTFDSGEEEFPKQHVRNDLELGQSEPKSYTHNQNGK